MVKLHVTPSTGAGPRARSQIHAVGYLLFGVATALGGLAFGAQPVAAEGTSVCMVGTSTTWQPNGGRLVLSIGGCAYRVTSAVDPYVITVTGPAAYSDTIYRGDGTARTSNVVLDGRAAGTYTITSSGVVGRQPDGSPLYGWSWSAIQVDPASVEIGPTPAPIVYPVPPPFVIPTLRVTKVTPGAGSRGTWRSVQPRITFSAQPLYSRDLTITLTDTATGRLVPIRRRTAC
ncbi:MAG: hypothetical protein P4L84_17565 [Isosphaeraceae bacterium]|nr:hypothetical protein [Isosphaeraceae bacterium]